MSYRLSRFGDVFVISRIWRGLRSAKL